MGKFIKKKLSRAAQLKADKQQFGSRVHMLDTIHLAYKHALGALDNLRRSNITEELDLGRRLFKYWEIKK